MEHINYGNFEKLCSILPLRNFHLRKSVNRFGTHAHFNPLTSGHLKNDSEKFINNKRIGNAVDVFRIVMDMRD